MLNLWSSSSVITLLVIELIPELLPTNISFLPDAHVSVSERGPGINMSAPYTIFCMEQNNLSPTLLPTVNPLAVLTGTVSFTLKPDKNNLVSVETPIVA